MLPLFDSLPQPTLAETIQTAVNDGATVVAASARAARALRHVHSRQQQLSGHEMWASPAIFDYEAWLQKLWHDFQFFEPEAPLLLTSAQEHALWKRVTQDDAQLVVSPDGLASQAQSAYTLLSSYEAHDARRTIWLETDAERFRHWAENFDRLCQSHRWFSRSSLEEVLAEAVQSRALQLPRQLFLAGFDRLTPAQEHLLQSIRNTGTQIETAEPPPQETCARTLLCAEDVHDELLICAQWCRMQLESAPEMRIGVIAPDVSKVQAEADRTFKAVLMPRSLDLTADAIPMPFEFSLGSPLSTVPAIKAALLMLRWLLKPLSEEAVTWMLLSGFFSADAAEYFALARFDFKQRDTGLLSPEIALSAMHENLKRSSAASTSFAGYMRQVIQAAAKLRLDTQTNSYSEWCESAEKILQLSGWPGYRTPDSTQFQAQKRFQRLLDEISLLDYLGNGVAYTAFLQTVERQASEAIFTPESRNAPIQILGASESSGQAFDAIWFLGADDTQWPLTGKPHSLLPNAIQRHKQMPHSSAAADMQLGRIVTARIAHSAPQCIVSYAQRNKEGELRPSPLLADVFQDVQPLSTAAFRDRLHIQSSAIANPALEIILSEPAIPWPAAASAGGADVLKEQAACPFQAFAKRRLATRLLDRTEWGLDAAERGNILHHILENIWSPETPEALRMVSLDDLKDAIAKDRLDALIEYHIGDAFRSQMREYAEDPWAQAYFASEQARLLSLLRDWLRCESQRQPFVVEAREERLNDVHIGSLKLNLRADRIDLLADASHLLIDYKTSEMSTSKWQGDRPDEPQLPLYAVYGNVDNVSGLLFAQIRAGKTGMVGRVADARQQLQANLMASSALVSQPYDDSMRSAWEDALRNLAEEFLQGEASVDPKRGAETCTYCPLPGLCRIAETGQTAGEDEVENGNA